MTEKYGDWRDDALNLKMSLHHEDSRFALPVCPEHGFITIRKKKVHIWKCNKCDFEFEVDEEHYRNWRKKMIEEAKNLKRLSNK